MRVPQAEINTAGVIIALSKLSGLSIAFINTQFRTPAQTCAILTERLDYAPRSVLPPMKLS